MFTLLLSALASTRSWFRTRAELQMENLALRHQLIVRKRSQRGRLRLDSAVALLRSNKVGHSWCGPSIPLRIPLALPKESGFCAAERHRLRILLLPSGLQAGV